MFPVISTQLMPVSLMTSIYLYFYGLVKAEQGEFRHVKKVIDILYDLGETYDYRVGITMSNGLKASYFIMMRKTNEALSQLEGA